MINKFVNLPQQWSTIGTGTKVYWGKDLQEGIGCVIQIGITR